MTEIDLRGRLSEVWDAEKIESLELDIPWSSWWLSCIFGDKTGEPDKFWLNKEDVWLMERSAATSLLPILVVSAL